MAPPIPPDIRRYLDGLVIAWHEQQRAALFERLNRFIFSAYITSLSPSDRATLEQMVAAGRPRMAVEEFIHDHVPNMLTVYRNALAEFQTLYLREVAGRNSTSDD
jgi:hypothetical protein